ncbi:MAG: DUF2911 domain-containing protein [Chitinophagaceae bacterium]
MKKSVLLSLAAATMFTFTAQAQSIKTPAPSPGETVKQAFGLGDITLDYSRPLARGRVIFGDLVPYNAIWRTGANSATKITFSDDVTFEGKAVKAGTYAFYTIPGKTSWEVMLTTDLVLGANVADYPASQEVIRVKVQPVHLDNMVESFTMNLDKVAATSAILQLSWEHTMVPINITTEIDARITKEIEKAMSPKDTRPYFQAANYYYENDKDLKQALAWSDKAIDQNPAYYVVHLKAKIQMKMKDYKGAILTAEKSKALAEAGKSADYVRLNEKLIEKAKSMK